MDNTKTEDIDKPKPKIKTGKKVNAVDELTTQEREAVTIFFHQYETGLREGTIFTKVTRLLAKVKKFEMNRGSKICSLLRFGFLISRISSDI